MSRVWIIAVLCIMGTLFAGCATTPPVRVVGNSYCRLAPELTWSTDDTKESITGIRTHNAKRRKVCGS